MIKITKHNKTSELRDVYLPLGGEDMGANAVLSLCVEVDQLRFALRIVAARLNRWAYESRSGGWSTHQVKPQQKLAAEIHSALDQ